MKVIFSDFDGTLTHNDQLGPVFFEILDICRHKKFKLIICSGRSAAWGHFLLTHFPLDICSMENGGCILRKKHEIETEYIISKEDRDKLKNIKNSLDLEYTSDSIFRKCDFSLEIKNVNDQILRSIQDQGLVFTRSNIHYNVSVPNINKLRAIEKIIEDDNYNKKDVVFFGDSYNDSCVFESELFSVGVGGIHQIVKNLKKPPKKLLKGDNGPISIRDFLSDL